jgi:BirA family biotin operon repressor/biotin-[acetyl-CoA-carboxylase] ligase
MENRIHILSGGLGSADLGTPEAWAAEPATEQSLAASHPLWAADMAALGPWEQGHIGLGQGTAPALASRVGAAAPVILCGPCGSSLDLAWRLAEQGGLPPWSAVLCLEQRAGRGQLRRVWLSPPGNVHAAWAWPPLGPELDGLASLLAGFMLASAFRDLGLDVSLKWPNDLLLGDLKVGGILVEERRGRLVVGVGLNLAWAPDASRLRDGHAVPAGSLAAALGGIGPALGPARLWARLVERSLDCYMTKVQGHSAAEVVRSIESLLAWRGRLVHVDGPGAPGGVLLGLATDGALRLVGREGEQLLYSGTIFP